ncbi:MAG: molybdenum cofactor biosynthesis protein MoaB [Desulfurococcales archaeon]|nr:molybdenum cofactor biosynthesis protein MoaB [Desulfurococcales archaeon]
MAWFALVVTSDRVYRGEKEDRLTPLAREYLEEMGHLLAYRRVVPNNPFMIRQAVVDAASRADVVLVTGGTGLSKRDVSIDVLEAIADRRVPGFGELHRMRSVESVGLRATLSRASAYMIGGTLVAVSPGSPDAVRVSLEILAEIAGHVRDMARGKSHWDAKACEGHA